jgi:hypothetical protein
MLSQKRNIRPMMEQFAPGRYPCTICLAYCHRSPLCLLWPSILAGCAVSEPAFRGVDCHDVPAHAVTPFGAA